MNFAPPPLVPGGGGHTRLRERRRREPILTKGQTLWYRFSRIPLRCTSCGQSSSFCCFPYQVLQKSYGHLRPTLVQHTTQKPVQAIFRQIDCLMEQSQGHFKQYHDIKFRPLQAIRKLPHQAIRKTIKTTLLLLHFQAVSRPLQAYIANTGPLFYIFIMVYCVV